VAIPHEKAAAGVEISDGFVLITSRGDVSPRLIDHTGQPLKKDWPIR